MIRVRSTEGVEVAVHELTATHDGAQHDGRPLVLVAHATGFHAHCYTPIATALAARHRCIGFDMRGHGHTSVDPEWHVDWQRFGDDALAVARHVAPGGGLIGFGHSMGGAALLMAAHRDPDRFDRLVLFEPISHQASAPALTLEEIRRLPIVAGALRRRRRFESFESAIENFRSKPPLSSMVDESLRNYVTHGFRRVDDEGVELRCPPELEATIFVTGRDNGVWDLLPEISIPACVIGGHVEERQPSAQAEAIAARLPNGRYVELDHQTHFGPFSHPHEIAELVASSTGI